MKNVFVLSFLGWLNFSFAQVDQVKMQKEYGEMDFAPQIAGYFNGEIPVNKICDVRGIYTNRGIKVIVFDLEYSTNLLNESIHVTGNQIPDSVCVAIRSSGVEQDLFFTKIKAVDLDGSIKHLSPMKLTVVFQEEE